MELVIVDIERCKGCGYCVTVCRKAAMHIDHSRRNRSGYPVVAWSPEKECSGCALCAEVCPDAALEVLVRVTG
ncbi:MAG: 4Fe-4S binding protein [Bacillota bacterium]